MKTNNSIPPVCVSVRGTTIIEVYKIDFVRCVNSLIKGEKENSGNGHNRNK